jgi:hypothetical protein
MVGGQPMNITLTDSQKIDIRVPNKPLSHYYYYGNNPLTGSTDSKIDDVRSYRKDDPYVAGLNINEETYVNYQAISIDGVNRITNAGEPKIYVFDAADDLNIGSPNQISGIQYKDFSASTVNPILLPENIDGKKSHQSHKLNTDARRGMTVPRPCDLANATCRHP